MSDSIRKPTKRDNFNRLYTIVQESACEDAEGLMAFIEHEIDLLDRKASAERKPTAKQVENVGIKAEIVSFLDGKEPMTAADVAKGCPYCVENGLKPQRVAALLGQLVTAGEVVKTEDKRKSFYSLA